MGVSHTCSRNAPTVLDWTLQYDCTAQDQRTLQYDCTAQESTALDFTIWLHRTEPQDYDITAKHLTVCSALDLIYTIRLHSTGQHTQICAMPHWYQSGTILIRCTSHCILLYFTGLFHTTVRSFYWIFQFTRYDVKDFFTSERFLSRSKTLV